MTAFPLPKVARNTSRLTFFYEVNMKVDGATCVSPTGLTLQRVIRVSEEENLGRVEQTEGEENCTQLQPVGI